GGPRRAATRARRLSGGPPFLSNHGSAVPNRATWNGGIIADPVSLTATAERLMMPLTFAHSTAVPATQQNAHSLTIHKKATTCLPRPSASPGADSLPLICTQSQASPAKRSDRRSQNSAFRGGMLGLPGVFGIRQVRFRTPAVQTECDAP